MVLSAWLIWIIIAIVLLIAEVFTPGFLLASFSLGAFVASAGAAIGLTTTWQMIVFSLVTIIVFFTIRPLVMSKMHKPENTLETNIDALVGNSAVVILAIDPNTMSGRVKVGGEEWSAASVDGSPLKEGDMVLVKRVEGNKVFVELFKEEKS